jgi:RNA polymerase sigma factor (sigma-70 family)
MNDDEILWKGVMKGDREMFLALYRKYYHSLLFIGLREVKDPQLVKDAIQQQFLYLWEKRATIQLANNVRSYLVTSFIRRLTADWKKSGNDSKFNVVWNSRTEVPVATPEERMIIKDQQGHLNKQIMAHINLLPFRQKELILLKFYEGLSYEEIVQKTGLAHRTVYNKIHEALKKLKMGMDKLKPSYRSTFHSILAVLLTLSYFISSHL